MLLLVVFRLQRTQTLGEMMTSFTAIGKVLMTVLATVVTVLSLVRPGGFLRKC